MAKHRLNLLALFMLGASQSTTPSFPQCPAVPPSMCTQSSLSQSTVPQSSCGVWLRLVPGFISRIEDTMSSDLLCHISTQLIRNPIYPSGTVDVFYKSVRWEERPAWLKSGEMRMNTWGCLVCILVTVLLHVYHRRLVSSAFRRHTKIWAQLLRILHLGCRSFTAPCPGSHQLGFMYRIED